MAINAGQLRDQFIEAILAAGWDWQTTDPSSPLRGTLTSPSGAQREIVAYLRNITHGGGAARPNEEYRIQISNVPELDADPEGSRRVLLGWTRDREVFAAFDVTRHTKPGDSPSSIQIALATLDRAVALGFATQSKGGGDVVCAFRPDRLASYVFDPAAAHDPQSPTVGDTSTSAAQAAAESAARPRRASGQGLRRNHAARVAIEQRAMRLATERLEQDGWTVVDVSLTASYDLSCLRGDQHLRVEVKGTTGAGDRVLLTANEVENARAHHPHVSLVVVSGIDLVWDPEPTAVGGRMRIINGWVPEDGDLRPVTYSYDVPRET